MVRSGMRKARVCLLTESYYPAVGGGETQTRVLAEDLIADGIDALVVTRRLSRNVPHVETVGSVPVIRTPPTGKGGVKRWAMLLTVLPTLLRRSRDYDLLFVSGFKALGIPAVLVAKLSKKRCILKADSNGEMSGAFFAGGLRKLGLSPSSRLVRPFVQLRNALLRRADCFIAISSDIAAELAQYGVQAERIVRIANSVDTDRFHPVGTAEKQTLRQRLGIPVSDTVAVYTGRLVSYKGLPLLLEVWTELHQRPGLRLILVGAGGLDMHNCEDQLQQYVRTNGLASSVQFTGPVDNVHEYLQAADIFVFPSEREAFGISLIEAMACGLPVISTAVGGMKDFVRHEHNALVIAPTSAGDLRHALARLLTEPNLGVRLGQAAVTTVQQRYAREAVAAQYLQLVQQLASPRQPRTECSTERPSV